MNIEVMIRDSLDPAVKPRDDGLRTPRGGRLSNTLLDNALGNTLRDDGLGNTYKDG